MRSKFAIKNILTNIILQIVVAISGLLLPRFYLLIYGSALNGMVSSVTQFMAYLMLVEAGISAASIVALYSPLADKNPEEINGVLAAVKKFYNQSGIIYLVLVLMLALIYPYIVKEQINTNTTRWIIIILSLSNLIDYLFLGKYKVLLTADQRGYIVVITQILGTVLNTAISIILMKLGLSIVCVKFVATFVYVLRTIIIFRYVKHSYPFLNFNVEARTSALSQRWSALIHQLAGVVLNNTNLIIMTFFLGKNSLIEISVYTIYQMIINLIQMVINSFSTALTASFGELVFKKDQNSLYKVFSNYEFIFFVILFITFSCLGNLYIPFVKLYTSNISDANYIRDCTALIFTLIGFANCLRVPSMTIICAFGRYKETQNRAIIEAILNIIIALILVNKFGLNGVLMGTLTAFIYSCGNVLYYNSKYLIENSLKQTLIRILRNGIAFVIYYLFVDSYISVQALTYLAWFQSAIILGITSTVWFLLINALCEPIQMCEIYNRVKNLIKV